MSFFRVFIAFVLFCFSSSCSRKSSLASDDNAPLVSMQIIDRNGLTETVSAKERLTLYKNIDYLKPQPYQKVLRIFSKDSQGRNLSKVTSYHANGELWQYLEAIDGRAHGSYKERYPNGKLRIEATIIEGVADINELAQNSWVFDGCSMVYNEQGSLTAKMHYNKGLLDGATTYYFDTGAIEKIEPFSQGLPHGDVIVYDQLHNIRDKIPYERGQKNGEAIGYFSDGKIRYKESYQKDSLINAEYFSLDGNLLANIADGVGTQIIYEGDLLKTKASIRNGLLDGKVEIYSKKGILEKFYTAKGEKKHGEEVIYYPKENNGSLLLPKLSLMWQDDVLHGSVKSWYENAQMESQKELCNNKKNGHSIAWYRNGDIMLIEDYENELLIKGSYYKRGERNPVSSVDSGNGLATIYDQNGIFLKKISYEKGKPLLEHTD
jgi:antitoxin component YwqK of YwqJK toxin-antitoxin module